VLDSLAEDVSPLIERGREFIVNVEVGLDDLARDGAQAVSDADLAAVGSAGYTDPQILAIVTLAVQFLLTNFINNVNQTDVDIPAASSVGTPA
jgi:hypothetical protein